MNIATDFDEHGEDYYFEDTLRFLSPQSLLG